MSGSTADNWATLVATIRSAPADELLATHNKVARQVADILRQETVPDGVRPLRVALLRSITAEVLENSIVACLAEHSFAADLSLGRLGNIGPEIWEDDSFVYAQPYDVCIVLAMAEHVLPGLIGLSESAGQEVAWFGIAPVLAFGGAPHRSQADAAAATQDMVVVGDADQFIDAETLVALLGPNAETHVLPGCDHFFGGDCAVRAAEAVARFVTAGTGTEG